MQKRRPTDMCFSPTGDSLSVQPKESIEVFPNQPDYFMIRGKHEKKVVDRNGSVVVRGNFGKLSFLNDTLMRAETGQKLGILKTTGDYLVKPLYETIVEKDGLVLCLRNGRIGSYDLKVGIWIRPKYESRIERIGKNYQVKEDGKYGVLNGSNERIISITYDEIKLWNDTSFMVRKGTSWDLIDLQENLIAAGFENLTPLATNEHGSIWKYVKDEKYGLASSNNGFISEPEFSTVINLGTDDDPIIFADQYLKMPGYHVVSYFNKAGQLIVSKAYTQPLFDKIVCEDPG